MSDPTASMQNLDQAPDAPTPESEVSGLALPWPPRALDARQRMKLWTEPRVRFWWLTSILFLLITFGFVLQGMHVRAHQAWLIENGEKVDARVVATDRETIKGRSQPPWSSVRLEFDWHGTMHTPPMRPLEGRKEYIVTNSMLPLHVNPNDPDDWTWLDSPLPLVTEMVGAMIALPVAASAFLAAILARARARRIYRDGEAIEALVLEKRISPIAPRCRAVRVTPAAEGEKQVYTIYVPHRLAHLGRGDALCIVRAATGGKGALAADWFA